jgi:putative oxidoreductase
MVKLLTSPLLSAIFRWILGLVFIYAGIHKITDPAAFSEAIYNYKLFPEILINPLAVWLPWLELLAGLSLIAGIWIKGGALILSVLSLAFAVAVGTALFRGLDISCGCFSLNESGERIQWTYIAQDLGLLVMGIQILWFDQGAYALRRRTGKIGSWEVGRLGR